MHLPAALTIPGTTDSGPFPTLSPKWRAYLRKKLGRSATSRGLDTPLAHYMARAGERADAVTGEILQTAGRCGPIAETHVDIGSKLTELAKCIFDHADLTTREGRRDVMLARAVADTGLRALREAMNTSVIAATMDTRAAADPLDAGMAELPSLDALRADLLGTEPVDPPE